MSARTDRVKTARARVEQSAPVGDVMIAWVHSEQVAHSWFMSMVGLLMAEPRIGPFSAMKCGTDGLPQARNKVAAEFLEHPGHPEWLFWVDTDMGFQPQVLRMLLESADPVDRPVVGALCFAWRETHTDGLGGFRCEPVPTLYRWAEREDGASGFSPMRDYPRDSLVQVAGTGSACVVVHRSVLERVAERFGPSWYTRLANPATGQLIGEDLSFCYRVLEAGGSVWVNTAAKTSHLKPIWVQEADFGG